MDRSGKPRGLVFSAAGTARPWLHSFAQCAELRRKAPLRHQLPLSIENSVNGAKVQTEKLPSWSIVGSVKHP